MPKSRPLSSFKSFATRQSQAKNYQRWHQKVLCTPESKKNQIISDFLFSIYDFLESGCKENLILSITAIKHSPHHFNDKISFEEYVTMDKLGTFKFVISIKPNKEYITIKIYSSCCSYSEKKFHESRILLRKKLAKEIEDLFASL